MTDDVYLVRINTSNNECHSDIVNSAKELGSFMRIGIEEQGPLVRVDYDIWFIVTVMFGKESDATFFRLKWS